MNTGLESYGPKNTGIPQANTFPASFLGNGNFPGISRPWFPIEHPWCTICGEPVLENFSHLKGPMWKGVAAIKADTQPQHPQSLPAGYFISDPFEVAGI